MKPEIFDKLMSTIGEADFEPIQFNSVMLDAEETYYPERAPSNRSLNMSIATHVDHKSYIPTTKADMLASIENFVITNEQLAQLVARLNELPNITSLSLPNINLDSSSIDILHDLKYINELHFQEFEYAEHDDGTDRMSPGPTYLEAIYETYQIKPPLSMEEMNSIQSYLREGEVAVAREAAASMLMQSGSGGRGESSADDTDPHVEPTSEVGERARRDIDSP